MSDVGLWRDASGRLTFDDFRVTDADFPAACRDVAELFALSPVGPPFIGLGQVEWDFERAGQSVGFDWDNWMGLMVVAKTEAAEPLVREIAEWWGANRAGPG